MLCVLGAAATGLGLEICQQGFAGFLWFRAVRTTSGHMPSGRSGCREGDLPDLALNKPS